MARYIGGRVLTGLATLVAVSILLFVAMHLVPGSYAEIVTGPFGSPEVRAELNAQYGLDEPLPVQYLSWLRNVATGNLGESLDTGTSVGEILERRAPVTFELALLSLLIAVTVGVPLALLAGISRRGVVREGSRLGGAIAMSTPDFVIGSVFVYLFSRYALGLDVGGYVPFTADPVENLAGMVLPAITLAVFGVALIVRVGRDAVGGVLSQPHITAALARGESMPHIVRHHVLRNASMPVLTVVGIYAGYLLGGAVVVENLFSLPGLGQEVLRAINGRDYAVVQGVVLVAAAAFIVISMVVDFAYGVIDPRIRNPSAA